MAGNNLGVASGRIDIDSSGLKNTELAIRSAGQGMLNFGQQVAGVFLDIVNTSAKFEKEMDFVQAVTNSTGEQMDLLKAKAIELGKESIFGPVALSQAFVELAKAGASVEDIIGGVGEAAVQLATAADVEIPFAGENLINILNTFKLEAADAGRVADLLAGSANASSVSLQDLVVSFKYAGPVAQGLGISIEELSDAMGILGQVGIKGSTAGTSLRQIMLNLSPPTEKAADRMKELGIITEDGANQFFDAQGNAKSLAEVFQILGDATKDLNNEQKTAALRDLFGVRAIPAALELMSQGTAGFQAMNDEINRTTAADVAAKRMDNLDGALKRFSATWEALKVEEGGSFLDGLKMIVDMARQFLIWFSKLPKPLKTFLIGAIGVIGALSILSGIFLLTIGNIVRAVRVFRELGAAFRVLTGLSRAFSISLAANPVVLIVAAILALIAALVLLYFHFKPFREFIDNLWQSIQRFWDNVLEFARDLPENVRKAWESIKAKADEIWDKVYAKVSEVIGGIINFFKELPGKVVGFFDGIWDGAYAAVTGFFSSVIGAIGRFVGSMAKAVGGFFSRLPGIIGNALKTALGAVGNFLKELPERFAYALGFVIGRLIRWGVLLVVNIVKIGAKVIAAVVRFLFRLPGIFIRVLTTIVENVVKWGVKLVKLIADVLWKVVTTFWNILTGLPGFIWDILTKIVNFFIQAIPLVFQAVWTIATTIVQTIWNIVSALPGIIWDIITGIISFLWSTVSEFLSVAFDIGSGFFEGVISFFRDLPGKIVGFLWDAVKAIGGMVSSFFNKAKEIGSNLWNGFKDGLFGSPHTKIEYAMWDMEKNVGDSIGTLKKQVRTLNGMGQRMPDLAGAIHGLPDAGQVAVNANGGGQIWNQQAPLIGSASIRDDRDIVELARQLELQRAREARARGRTLVTA